MTDAPLTQPVSRRTFISKSLAIVGLSAVMPAAFVRAVFAEEPIGSPAPLASTAGQAGRTLVIVQLAGGNDGLNTLVPYADGAYYDARPGLAVNPEAALHLDDRVALHPNLGGLKRALRQRPARDRPGRRLPRAQPLALPLDGDLAHRLDRERRARRLARPPARRHEAGVERPLACGQRRRRRPALAREPALLRAVAGLGPRLRAADGPAAPATERPPPHTDWGRLYALQASLGGALALVSDTGLQAYRSTVDLQAEAGDYEPAVEYPESPLAQGLQTCAQLIAANLGTGVCYVTTGGFDSHARQNVTHPELLGAIDGALGAFQADIEAQGLADRITLLMWTEFGPPRPRERLRRHRPPHRRPDLAARHAGRRRAARRAAVGWGARREPRPQAHDRLPLGLRLRARAVARRRPV